MPLKERIEVFLLLCLAAGGAVYFSWYAFKAWRENRVVADTPASRVRSAAQGYVHLEGRAALLPQRENRAPLTGIACAWWRYTIEERGGDGRRNEWRTIESETSAVPFILDDGTGRCLIDPRGAEVFPSAKDLWFGATERPEVRIPDGDGLVFKLAGRLLGAGRYRYTEHRIGARERIFVLGAYRTVGGASGDHPERAVAQLLLARFDANHDGVLGAAEWERARAAARQEVVEAMLVKPGAPALSVLSKPSDGRAFLLSASDDEGLRQQLRRRAAAGLAIGVGSGGLFGWMVAHLW